MEQREDSRSDGVWLVQLRASFVSLAQRRVPADAVEDVVQDALTIVSQKAGLGDGSIDVDGRPRLAWCYQVLRNTVGNFYQKQRTRSRESSLEDAHELSTGRTPLEALQEREVRALFQEALDEMAADEDSCRRYLLSLLQGQTPATLAEEEGIEAPILYRRIYRCRGKLRKILERKGVLP